MENETNLISNDDRLAGVTGGSDSGTCPNWHMKGRAFLEWESADCPTPEKKGSYTSGAAVCSTCAKR